jgi:C-terminal processing protease CtpA/Prc
MAASKYEDAFMQICAQVASNHPRGNALDCAASSAAFASTVQTAEQLREALARSVAAAGLDGVRVMTERESLAESLRVSSSQVGVGVSLREVQLLAGSLKVVGVLDDSTAQAAGITAGDEIVSINGKRLSLMPESAPRELLQGEAGSKVQLGILRAGETKVIAVERDIDGLLGLEYRAEASNFEEIQSLNDKSPAAQAGLQNGDVIVSVNGVDASNKGYEWTHNALDSGLPNTIVELRVLRQGVFETRSVVRRPLQNFMLTVRDLRGQMGGRDDWNKMQIEHFDWVGLPDFISEMSDYLNKQHDLILDLRGAGGDNPELAARLAATFMTDDFVFATVNGAGVQTNYRLKDGVLTRQVAGGAQVTLVSKPERYRNRLLILVDSRTSGAAAVFAAALQKAGRAEIFGDKTEVPGAFQSTYRIELDGNTVMLKSPAGRFTAADGKPIGMILPDHKVGVMGDALDQAFLEIRGYGMSGPHGEDLLIVGLGVIVIISLVFGIAWLIASRFEPSGETEEKKEQVNAEPEPGEQDSATESSSETVPAWMKILLAVLAMVLFGMMAYASRSGSSSARAARSEIVVVAYLDDSALSAKEESVIDKLKAQYAGDISFKVVRSTDSSVPEGVKQFPTVEIAALWFDKDGNLIASHRGFRANYAQRSFHRDIGMYTQSSYGNVQVKRIKLDQESGK